MTTPLYYFPGSTYTAWLPPVVADGVMCDPSVRTLTILARWMARFYPKARYPAVWPRHDSKIAHLFSADPDPAFERSVEEFRQMLHGAERNP